MFRRPWWWKEIGPGDNVYGAKECPRASMGCKTVHPSDQHPLRFSLLLYRVLFGKNCVWLFPKSTTAQSWRHHENKC